MVKYGVDMGNPYAFNLARLVPASLVLLFAVARTPALRKFEWRDTWSVFVLGVAGHVVLQVGFIHGIHASSATSAALILALTACGGTRVSAEPVLPGRPADKAREGGIPSVFRPKRNAERSEAEWFSRDGSPGERRLGFTTGC